MFIQTVDVGASETRSNSHLATSFKWMYTVLQIDIELKKSELRRKKRLNKEASTFRGSVVQNNKPASVGSWHQTWVCHCVDYEPDGIQKHGADDRSRWLRPTRRQIEWMWYKQRRKNLSSNCSEYPPLVKLYRSYICIHMLSLTLGYR